MDAIRPNWQTQQLADAIVQPVGVLRLPMGDRAYGFTRPTALADALGGGFFDADTSFDAELYFSADGVVLEAAARLVSVDGIEQTAQPIEGGVLSSLSQGETPIGAMDLDNGDHVLSDAVGREYMLRQPALVYSTFPSLDPVDALTKRDGRITSWTLTAAGFRVEFQAL